MLRTPRAIHEQSNAIAAIQVARKSSDGLNNVYSALKQLRKEFQSSPCINKRSWKTKIADTKLELLRNNLRESVCDGLSRNIEHHEDLVQVSWDNQDITKVNQQEELVKGSSDNQDIDSEQTEQDKYAHIIKKNCTQFVAIPFVNHDYNHDERTVTEIEQGFLQSLRSLCTPLISQNTFGDGTEFESRVRAKRSRLCRRPVFNLRV